MRYFLILTLFFSTLLIAQDKITVKELQEHIYFLAADSLEGRKPGTKGGVYAANYIKEDLEKSGLKLLEEKGFQNFDVVVGVNLGDNNTFAIGNENYALNEDFIPVSFTSNSELDAEVIFAGYGFQIKTDSLDWDDYKNIDVEGKWVMLLRGSPEPESPHSDFFLFSTLRSKVGRAQENNAAGVIFVSGNEYDPKDELVKLRYDRTPTKADIPVISIKRELADKILQKSGQNINDLEKEINTKMTSRSLASGTKVKAIVSTEYQNAQTQNVLAMLPGEVENQFIVLGAHYDHLGYGGPGSGSRRPDTVAVHNGADDNASGTAAVLEIAEYFATADEKPRNSMLFMFFGAEEMGLLGSKYFAENPFVDLEQIKMMMNLDMVGRLTKDDGAEISIGGIGTAEKFEEIVTKYTSDREVSVNMDKKGQGPSDHSTFYNKKIPVLFFFTGAHQDYHTPEDDADLIDYEGLVTISEIAADILKEQANSTAPLAYQETKDESSRGMGRFKVTLGIMPDYISDTKGLKIDGVTKGGPASDAGLLTGDIIIKMADKEIGNIYDYMNSLSEFKSGQTTKVVVKRGDQELEFEVTF